MIEQVAFFEKNKHLNNNPRKFTIQIVKQGYCRMHYHDFYELVIVLNGSGEHIASKGNYPISTGDVFVIKPNVIHGYDASSKLTIVNVIFESNFITKWRNKLADVPGYFLLFELDESTPSGSGKDFKLKHTLIYEELDNVSNIIFRILQEEQLQQHGFCFAMSTLFNELVLTLARSYENERQKISRKMVLLGKMLKFIESNHAKDISREDIFAAANVSISVGNRIFKTLLNETPIERLIKVRINKSLELLRTGKYSVLEVAFQVGFQDSNYFSTRFRKLVGKSPRHFLYKA